MPDTSILFELADQLKDLRDTKKNLEQQLKELNAQLDEKDAELAAAMAESETQNFTRAGVMFCLTNTTRASATAERKEDLFGALRTEGFGDLIYETINANSLSAFVKEQMAENADTLRKAKPSPHCGKEDGRTSMTASQRPTCHCAVNWPSGRAKTSCRWTGSSVSRPCIVTSGIPSTTLTAAPMARKR